jgi:hypothetical protein
VVGEVGWSEVSSGVCRQVIFNIYYYYYYYYYSIKSIMHIRESNLSYNNNRSVVSIVFVKLCGSCLMMVQWN